MSLLIQYLVKLTICLGVVWLFYHFILRKLTFYNSNRWYLLAYTLLSFVIPFVNISSLVENKSGEIVRFVPSVHQYTIALEEATHCPIPIWSTNYDKWDFLAFGLMTVAGILFLRFAISFISFLRMQRKAKLISKDGVKLYQVDENIIPFSFGNSIFINSNLHTQSELQEIVRHEFVHVRQRHTIDIVWAEMLCIINWYNPFAWLLKRSIRQNLEFIADNNVIDNGIDRKEYQFLLLKVIGNNQFSIATQFNFSSLKKRIAMMNKTKSARRQLGRFLFLVPVLAIILLSFRQTVQRSSVRSSDKVVLTDTIPDITVLNSKGYYIDIKGDNGNCTVVVRDKERKEVKRVLLTEWNAKDDYYENLYGEILSPVTETVSASIKANNPAVTAISIKGKIATVTLKNGKTEVYTLSVKDEKKAFEKRCGIEEIAIASEVAVEPVTVIATTEPTELVEVTAVSEPKTITTTIAEDFEISDNKAVMKLKNGKVEEYNLADPKEKETFEKKFGKIIKTSVNSPARVSVVADVAEPTVVTTIPSSPSQEVAVIREERVPLTTEADQEVPVEPEVLLTITKKTTQQELDAYKAKLKSKGIELMFNEVRYENGVLVRIAGQIKSGDNTASFVETGFSKITVSQFKKGDKTYFRIDVGNKVVS